MVGVDADFFLFGFEGVAANVDKEGVYFFCSVTWKNYVSNCWVLEIIFIFEENFSKTNLFAAFFHQSTKSVPSKSHKKRKKMKFFNFLLLTSASAATLPKYKPNPALWLMDQYHLWQACVNDMEMKINDYIKNRDPRFFGPMQNWTIPSKPIGTDKKNAADIKDFSVLLNPGLPPRPPGSPPPNPWAYVEPDMFYAVFSQHGLEMWSWADKKVQDFWVERNGWYKPEFQEERWWIWEFQQHNIFKFCAAKPMYDALFGDLEYPPMPSSMP